MHYAIPKQSPASLSLLRRATPVRLPGEQFSDDLLDRALRRFSLIVKRLGLTETEPSRYRRTRAKQRGTRR